MKELDFISILDETGRVSSLQTGGRRSSDKLIVVGGLNHNVAIEPNSVEDCDKLITWLQEWREKKVVYYGLAKEGKPTIFRTFDKKSEDYIVVKEEKKWFTLTRDGVKKDLQDLYEHSYSDFDRYVREEGWLRFPSNPFI